MEVRELKKKPRAIKNSTTIAGYNGARLRRQKTTQSVIPFESDEQIAFVQWCRLNKIVVHHSGNEIGGSSSAMKVRAIKMKKMGTSKGFPDLLVFIPVYGTAGDVDAYQMCAIEMKRKTGGRTSTEQKVWLDILQASGVMCAVCKGAEEAIKFIDAIRKEINE